MRNKTKAAVVLAAVCLCGTAAYSLAATGTGAIASTWGADSPGDAANAPAPGSTVIGLRIGEPTITVNGREEPIDENGTVPVMQNDRTLLPARAVVEAMGGTAQWDAATRTVTLTLGGTAIRMVIGSGTLHLNETPQTMDAPPAIMNGRTMLPIRFVAEGFGYDVDWDGAARTVTLTGPDAQGASGGEKSPADASNAEAVDLGLSVKWASFNVGAEKPEDYGTYFGWGEVSGEKTSEDNDDYPNAGPPKNICGTEYDAAHMLWGGVWRMPTKEQARELVDDCDWEETALNGVAGFRVTGKNGNSIFLSAGGGRDGTRGLYTAQGADFWTGDISDADGEAWCFTFYNGNYYVDDLWRHYGFAVRPVMEYDAGRLTVNDPVSAIIQSKAFEGFGHLLMPWDDRGRDYGMPIAQVASTMPYHNYIQPQVIVEAVNYMIDEANAGKIVFYDFYSAQDKMADPSKENAGLFFFRGDPGAPFAIISPGGGFSYVGSLHAGFPLAWHIAESGYNAFVLKYRTGGERMATEDLAAAVAYVVANADGLGVGSGGYSLWGGSAGGMMVTNIVTKAPSYYGVDNLSKPAVQVLEYTTYMDYLKNDRPLFSVVGDSDSLADYKVMQERVDYMRGAGLDVEFHVYPDLRHGFGRGDGTSAEGWPDLAIRFWEKYID
jgi:acetyl esterase/lipase